LGHADIAYGRIARAIAFARDSNNPFDLAGADCMKARYLVS
jgi:hypothetical protein